MIGRCYRADRLVVDPLIGRCYQADRLVVDPLSGRCYQADRSAVDPWLVAAIKRTEYSTNRFTYSAVNISPMATFRRNETNIIHICFTEV